MFLLPYFSPPLIQILFTFNCLEFFHDSNKIEEKDILQIYEEIENPLNNSVKLDPFKLTEDLFQKTIEKTGIKWFFRLESSDKLILYQPENEIILERENIETIEKK